MAIGNKSSGRTATAGLACHRIPLGLDPGEPSSMCRLGLDPREAMLWLFAPPRAVAVQSPPVRACQFPDRVSGPVAKLIQLLLELDHGTTCR